MAISRRGFLEVAVTAGAGLTASCSMTKQGTQAAAEATEVIPAPRGEWVANTLASAYRAYRSKPAKTAEASTWAQIDLGATHAIDSVKVYPASDRMKPGQDHFYSGAGFPVRFKVEVCDSPDFRDATAIVDHTGADFPNPEGYVQNYRAGGAKGRYVRLTATRLMKVAGIRNRANPPEGYYLALTKMAVYSGGKEISVDCPVSVDDTYGNYDDVAQVTRADRAGGETVLMNNPANATPASSWKPPAYKARKPLGGVTLNGGIFQTAMEKNISYLLDSFTVDELLRQFRQRTGIPNPAGLPKPKTKFWEADLAGSNAGRFLMGAGNTVRWMDHPELRRRMNAVVEGIAQCKERDGYIMAYPKDTIFFSERAAYTRAWLTHGLIEAGNAGNKKAFRLLRGYYDWFNQCSYLSHLMRFATQGGQGMIANTRLYFTPVGKPADIQVIQRYFQENYWLDQLAARDDRAIWQYPYDRPHCYLLTNVLAMLDLYRATGERRYLNAVKGAWDLYHDKWENTGGTISIIEFIVCPPKSYLLNVQLEELCGNSFWAFLNQRLHELEPEQEKYVTEIEKSIYNAGLAALAGPQGFRYHQLLVHQKDKPTAINTCCEGQGTRLIGSLPEHIYSIAADGIYVNLYEPSTVDWKQHGQHLRLKMTTKFPFDPEVKLEFAAEPARAKIRVRVPAWAAGEMAVQVNGRIAASRRPGSYVTLDRTWKKGDTVNFKLPAELRVVRYTGFTQIPEHDRFALLYGPILLAAVGTPEVRLQGVEAKRPESLTDLLQPMAGPPLHYTVKRNPGIEYMPYWQIDNQQFNCFPAVARKA